MKCKTAGLLKDDAFGILGFFVARSKVYDKLKNPREELLTKLKLKAKRLVERRNGSEAGENQASKDR